MEKKKKSVLTIILNILVIIIFVAAVLAGGFIGFIYFKYKVNVFDCINQLSKLNETVNVSTIVSNQPTDADYNSIKTKIENAESGSVTTQLKFTDKELCAYLNHNLNQIANINFAGTTLNLQDSGLEVLQIKFANIDLDQPSTHYCDMNVVLKLNISSVKNAQLKGFPASLLKNFIPDELYISATSSVDEVEGGYQVTPKNVTVNNLPADKTRSFFNNINKFTKFTTAEELNQNVSTVLADALIGDNSVYSKLHDIDEHGATGYGWQRENNFMIYFVSLTDSHTITYNDPLGADNPNITEYTICNNLITLKDLSKNGYSFLGWYLDADDESTKVTTIDAATMQEYNLTCKWEIITYTITCDLRGGKIGSSSEYKKTYTVEDEAFTLPIAATKKIYDKLGNESKTLDFAGWLGENITTITKNVIIEKGSYGDRHYSAYYEGEDITLTMIVDGTTVHSAKVETGTILPLSDLNHLISNKLNGYTVNNWYTNNTLTNQYDYSAQLLEDKTLYATANYITDSVYFYPYLSQIENALQHSTVLNISSREMLIGYIDYCAFYDITQGHDARLNLTYMFGHGAQAMVDEIKAASDERGTRNKFSKAYKASMSYNAGYAHYYLTETDTATLAQNHFSGEDFANNVYTQQDYALRADDLNIRSNSYNNFAIKYIGKQIRVTTTEQLVWVLENGYSPICEAGSSAESIYQQAKDVLINICSDSMNDIEKLQAIYKWLALNVNYDQEAYSKITHHQITDAQARTYDSWYAEGVFNYGKAVCEGYAKALLIMAKLEGIPTICVSGDGHMWNKVYLNGTWYGIDATHADLGIQNGGKELFTNTAFLFTDTYKTSKGYTADNYTEFEAKTTINAYDKIKFTYNDTQYDLFIDNQNELNALINYVSGYHVATSCAGCEYYTLEFATNINQTQLELWFQFNGKGWNILLFSEPVVDNCGNSVYMIVHSK